MATEIEMLQLLLEGQKDIQDQIKRVHDRLDTITEKATINEQSIKFFKEALDEEKGETKKRFDVVHQSIRRRDATLKWIASSIILPLALSLFAFLKSIKW